MTSWTPWHARPSYIAALASLLAFVAWQVGNGALANALDRALADGHRLLYGSATARYHRRWRTTLPDRPADDPEEVTARYDNPAVRSGPGQPDPGATGTPWAKPANLSR